jgi:hypothetical protein
LIVKHFVFSQERRLVLHDEGLELIVGLAITFNDTFPE